MNLAKPAFLLRNRHSNTGARTTMKLGQILCFTVVVVSLTAGQSATAAEWWYIGSATDGMLEFIDIETLISTPPSVKYWDYFINNETDPSGKASKSRVLVNCSTRTSTYLTTINYSRTGDPKTLQGSGLAKDIAPGTVGESELKFACGTKSVREAIATKLQISPELFAEHYRSSQTLDSTPPQ